MGGCRAGAESERGARRRVGELGESHGFTALAADQCGASSEGMRVAAQAAVAALLVHFGHTVVEAPDWNGIVVPADGPNAGA